MSDIAPLVLTITTAGLNAFTEAQGGADIDLTIATVGVTAQPFVVAPTLTALPGETKQLDTVSGEVLDNAIVHLVARDSSADVYDITGFGLFLSDGTLFAVYGQVEPLFQKSGAATAFLVVDLRFPTVDASAITFGDTNLIDPPASETTHGVARIATQALVDEGDDDETIVSPLKLAVRLAAAFAGFLDNLFASAAETIAGIVTTKAVNPAGLLAALDARFGAGAPTAFAKTMLAAVSATATRALLGLGNVATLNTGAGNGIDADKLDGLEGASYLRIIDSGSNANGRWTKYSDGTIVQSGTIALNANGTPNISGAQAFPIDFPNACFGVVGNITGAGGQADFDASLIVSGSSGSPGVLTFLATCHGNNGANMPTTSFFWRAEGN